jgi:hypothetical protein
VAVGGWLGTRSARLHFCGDRGSGATVLGPATRYPRHPARWLIGRDVASVAWLRGAFGVWRAATIGRPRARARRGREPAMKLILRYLAYVAAAAALLAQPAWAWHQHQQWQDGWYQPRHHLRYQPAHNVWHQPRHYVWHQPRHHLRSQPRHYVWYQPQPQPQLWYQLQEPAWYLRWRDAGYQPPRDLRYQPRLASPSA